MPKHLTLHDCLKICHHYESLQYHLNVVKPTDKPVESITKCRFNRGGKQQPSAKRTGTFRGQPNTRPANSSNKFWYDSSQRHMPGLLINLLQL